MSLHLHRYPEEIDVYTGALSEAPIEGAITGPTLACLIADQFIRLKRGDSFWYERRVGPQKFTEQQLQQLFTTTLAGVICKNSDTVTNSQKYVMHVVSLDNPIVDCIELDTFDFIAWKEDEEMTVDFHTIKFHREQSNIVALRNNDDANNTKYHL